MRLRSGFELGVSVALALSIASAPAIAQDVAPLSAIDWLSESLDAPADPIAVPGGSRLPEEVTVRPLGQAGPDGAGALTSAQTGLPRALWGDASRDDVIDRLQRFPKETLPAVRDLFRLILLARLDAPRGPATAPEGALFTARVDAALDRGDLDTAERLIAAAPSTRPDLFRRAFDLALLTGEEDSACARLQRTPTLSPSYPVRIFCLARTGDWRAAAITLRTADALGALEPEQQALLDRFLELEAFDNAPPLPMPRLPTPLEMRLHEAIGEPIPTNTLPLAFAHSDLRRTAGWKARVTAAERLAHAGVLSPERLARIYMERAPAASGEPWDRVAAMQRLLGALDADRPRAIADTLAPAARAMQAAGLGPSFAAMVVPRLGERDLPGAAGELAWRLRLLSPGYEDAALDPAGPSDAAAEILRAIAQGLPVPVPPETPLETAIAAAFAAEPGPLPEGWQARLSSGPLGTALLDALALLPATADDQGDLQDVTLALSVLRRIGLEDTARRAAIDLLLQDEAI